MPTALSYAIIPVTPFQQNCALLWCNKTKAAAVVDPGGEADVIRAEIAARALLVERILVTHGHVDHVAGVAELAESLKVPVEGPHVADRYWLELVEEQGRQFGIAGGRAFTPDRWLQHGDEVTFGEIRMNVLHCPGHTPGHVVFHHPGDRLAFVGDVLFRGSVGRTDFPGGSFESLLGSIRGRLWPLGDDVSFLPGHGPSSTFGHERRTNPFCGDDAAD